MDEQTGEKTLKTRWVIICSVWDLTVAKNSRETRFLHRRNGRMDGRTDGPTDGRTNPLIEMRGRI